jgi:hypothetical protein
VERVVHNALAIDCGCRAIYFVPSANHLRSVRAGLAFSGQADPPLTLLSAMKEILDFSLIVPPACEKNQRLLGVN